MVPLYEDPCFTFRFADSTWLGCLAASSEAW
jgi:hypothetical protein